MTRTWRRLTERPLAPWGVGSLAILLCLPLAGAATTTAAASVPASPPGVLAAVPPTFSDTAVAAVPAPTDVVPTPGGTLLVTSQGGELWQVDPTTGVPRVVLDLRGKVCTNSERGLLGVALDPGYPTNGYVYLYSTRPSAAGCPTGSADSPTNRVSRYTANRSTGDVDPGSEKVVLGNILNYAGNHNGGDLLFGKDGKLYVSVGDGGCDYTRQHGCASNNQASRDVNTLLGKVLRINTDGSTPADNPFVGPGTARCFEGNVLPGTPCSEAWARGFRNPFRMAADPDAAGTVINVNDVGQNTWEEVDRLVRGRDYGWNVREGRCRTGSTTDCPQPSGYEEPIAVYSHAAGCGSITGGAFVPDGVFPASYNTAYLYADYVCNKIFALTPEPGGGYRQDLFASGLAGGTPVALAFGPTGAGTRQALYYAGYGNGGELRRITWTDSPNRAPVAKLSATPTSGAAPLSVRLSAAGSLDPDGNPLTYRFAFGDGTPDASGSASAVSHSYRAGRFQATVTVSDSAGASSTASVPITSGQFPSASITKPPGLSTYRVGQQITLTGSGTDPADGSLPGSRLSWTVVLHHNTHTHPFLGPVSGSSVTLTAPAPEDLAASTTSYLEVRLTATNSAGLTSTTRLDLRPTLVPLEFTSNLPGVRVTVNGSELRLPETRQVVPGWQLFVAARSPGPDGARLLGWSDGGHATHTVVAGTSPARLSVAYDAPNAPPLTRSPRRAPRPRG